MMRYATAVRRLRQIAEDAQRINLPDSGSLVDAIYTFGAILEGSDDLDAVDVVLVFEVPADELTWGAEPQWTIGIIDLLRLNKAPIRWYLRPAGWPVWNHYIREPLRIYSAEDGADEQALAALADRQTQRLRLPSPSDAKYREQLTTELDAARQHLRTTQENYWERDWRSEHKGAGIYPENHLWNAVWGYLDLHDATQQLEQ